MGGGAGGGGPYSTQPNPFAAPGGQSAFGGSPNPAGGYATPGGAGMVPYGQAPLARPMPGAPLQAGHRPTRRNALLTWLLPTGLIFMGFFLSVVLGLAVSPAFFSLFGLFALGATVWYVVLAIQMANEVKAVTRTEDFAWWPIFVPFYGMYWMWILVPQEVSKAKQLLGIQQPTQSIVLYIFLWHFAFASDLNDMVR